MAMYAETMAMTMSMARMVTTIHAELHEAKQTEVHEARYAELTQAMATKASQVSSGDAR